MHKLLILIFSLLIIISHSYSQPWQDYISNDWNKARETLSAKTLMISGSWFAGMYLLSFGDEYLNENSKRLNKGYLKHYFKSIDNLGYGLVAVPASIGIAGISFLTNDKKLQKTALTSVESIIATSAIVYALKISIGRKRPFEKRGSWFFEPFGGWDDSFPSGHTSTAFALITPWVYYYKKPWTYALFILPASTALSRMIFDRHWATDVLTGGAIGYAVGYYLTKWHIDFEKTQKSEYKPPMVSFSISF
jgi:PAP2 superfamily protein